MFSSIEIRGLGPHTRTVLHFDADGVSAVEGPSEAGKSTLVDAICFVLWGADRTGRKLDDREIRDGHDEARVDLTLRSGTTVSRSLAQRSKNGTRGKTVRRMTKSSGETAEYLTEDDWMAALMWMGGSKVGGGWNTLRHVMVPFAWLPLAQGAGSGRPFRDLLNNAVGSQGVKQAVIAELMRGLGHSFRHGDPVNQRDAEELRRVAGQKRDQVDARLSGRRADLEATQEAGAVEAPPTETIAEARETLRREEEWAKGDKARARAEEAAIALSEARQRHEAWTKRREELGNRPPEADGLQRAQQQVTDAENRTQFVTVELSRARALLEGLDLERRERRPGDHLTQAVNKAKRRASDALAALEGGDDVCPCCKRAGWTDATAARRQEAKEAKEAKEAAEAAMTEAMARLAREEDMRLSGAQAMKKELEAKIAEHTSALERLAGETEKARQDLATERAGSSAAMEWDRQMRALGAEPRIPGRVPAPPDPKSPRPSADEVRGAREVVTRAEKAAGAAAERRATIARLQRDIGADEELLEHHVAEYDRLDALVEAVRREPSESVRRLMARLGDLGPVELRLLEEGGVEVLVDGRPWHLASTGRQVVADVWIRAGLRRAIGKAKLPLFIDCAQDVGGQDLPTPAPAIVLTTTDGAGLTVALPGQKAA